MPEKRSICFCCSLEKTVRTIRRHRRNRLKGIAFNPEDSSDESSSDESSPGSDEGSLNNEGATHEPEMEWAAAGPSSTEEHLNSDQDHSVRRNPPVTISDWPDPTLDESEESDGSDSDAQVGEEQDPEFIEQDGVVNPEAFNESEWVDGEFEDYLIRELGDEVNEELMELYQQVVSRRDLKTLEMLSARLRAHFSRETYNELRFGVCKDLNLPSDFIAWRRLRILSGLEHRAYDCCVNSCICFLGKYRALRACLFCNEARYNHRGKPRRVFRYTPLIPQLQAMYQSWSTVEKLRYRAQHDSEPHAGEYCDVFDGHHYQNLRARQVSPDNPYCFFGNPEDIALGLSTDGFTLFKRWHRGYSTAWPIILLNYNLDPHIRTHLENVICVGVIPGPRQCKDVYSFLIPLLEELLQLEHGIATEGLTEERVRYRFVLRAFVILVFGDIPAVSKLLAMKGHNSFSPCRTCNIEGVLCEIARSSVYYVPLSRPGQLEIWESDDLPMRTHQSFIDRVAELDAAPTKAVRKIIAKHYGIRSESIFSRLKSIDLSASFPYDIMHLLFENLAPNLVLHWTGGFKGLDVGSENYQLTPYQWEHIGRETAGATRTIPAEFVGTLPDIAQDRNLYKAEAYAFWIQYIAPALLEGRVPAKYHRHLLLLRKIIFYCLEFTITSSEVDDLEDMIQQWVREYEQYYYQFRANRLPACPLTIHALLHIPYYIRHTGPLWTSWAFVMERFCGHLLPAVKNRVQPYENLDYYIQRRAQVQVVSTIHNLSLMKRPRPLRRVTAGGVEISSRETVYPEFPALVLGPSVRKISTDTQLLNQITKFLGPMFPGRSAVQLKSMVRRNSLVRYGSVRIAGSGDKMRTFNPKYDNPVVRDNTYVRYTLFPDANAAFRHRPDVPQREVQYGQLTDIFKVNISNSDGSNSDSDDTMSDDSDSANCSDQLLLIARVVPCDTQGLDVTHHDEIVRYNKTLTPIMVDLRTVEAVIGRIERANGWAIVDRSGSSARTTFTDDAEDDE